MKNLISPKLVSLTFGVLVLCFAIGFYIFAWTEPTVAPPDGNISAPINVSGTGQAKRYKDDTNRGYLGVAADPTGTGYDSNYGLTVGYSGNKIGIKVTGDSYFQGSTSDSTKAVFNAVNFLGTSILYVRNDGRVGIGTTAPNSELHVVGNIRHTMGLVSQGANYAFAWVRFNEDQNGNSLLLGSGGLTVIGGGESVGEVRGRIGVNDERLVLASDNTGASIAHHFITNLQLTDGSGSGWANRIDAMVILGNGNVGIGTTAPDSRLHVKASGTSWQNHLVLEGSDAGSDWNILVDSGLTGVSDNALRFKYNTGTEALTLLTNGRVGIGTTSPNAQLHIYYDGITLRQTIIESNSGGILILGQANAAANNKYWTVKGSSSSLYIGTINDAFDTTIAAMNIARSTRNVTLGVSTGGSRFNVDGNVTIGNLYTVSANAAPADGMIVQGNVGIGTTAPGTYKLNVDGGTGVAIYGSTTGDTAGVSGSSTGVGGAAVLGSNTSSGIGVQGSNTSSGIGVFAWNTSTGYGLYCKATAANKCGGNQPWYNASDRILKENIRTVDNALARVLNLQGVVYNLKSDPEKTPQIGFVAQDVLPYVPEVVSFDENTQTWGMQTSQLTALLVEAIKEQQKEIEALKAQLGNK